MSTPDPIDHGDDESELNEYRQPTPDANLDPAATSTSDDLSQFRCSQSFAEGMTTTMTTVVLAKKPNKKTFIWLHKVNDWSFSALSLEIGEGTNTETYLLNPQAASSIDSEMTKMVALRAYTTREDVVCLWPVAMPRQDGRTNSWSDSARDIAFNHAERWLQAFSSQIHSAYLIKIPTATIPPPKDPPMSMVDLVKIAFKGRLISDPNHIVLRKLRGEI